MGCRDLQKIVKKCTVELTLCDFETSIIDRLIQKPVSQLTLWPETGSVFLWNLSYKRKVTSVFVTLSLNSVGKVTESLYQLLVQMPMSWKQDDFCNFKKLTTG